MKKNSSYNSNTNGSNSAPTTRNRTTASSAATAVAALSAMLAFNACPAQAFQPSFFLPSQRPIMHHTSAISTPALPASVAMRCSSPWDYECGGMQPFRGGGGFQRRRRGGFGPMVITPGGVYQGSSPQPRVREPEVTETDDSYQATFDLPVEVDQDGLDVSVSGRLLTVKARVTREEDSSDRMSGRRRGWVTRSSRTEIVSRSFVLPEGVSTAGVKASLVSDGKVEIKFNKDAAAPAVGSGINSTQAAAAVKSTEGTAEAGEKISGSAGSFTSAEVPSSLSGSDESPASSAGANVDVRVTAAYEEASAASAAESPTDSSVSSASSALSLGMDDSARRPRSVFEELGQEFGDFAKAMWGEEALRFPTEEEMAERIESAREERAKRVMAMRRATMAADISENKNEGEGRGSSYVVKVALPEGATRDSVKLTVTPDDFLRVSFKPEGRGMPFFKDVRLPKDALFSEISAKFEAEQGNESNDKQGAGESSTAGQGVSSLEVTVGKVAPPEPKRVDIL